MRKKGVSKMISRKIVSIVFILSILVLLTGGGNLATSASDADFNFIVFGDSRIAMPGAPVTPAYLRILEETNLINPDMVIHTGDLIFGYGDSDKQLKEEYAEIFDLMATLTPEVHYVPGNHDYQTSLSVQEFKKWTGQEDYFSFDYEGVVFIILNTELPGQVGEVAGEQHRWLEEELEKNKDARALFIFTHRPLFSFLFPDPDTDNKNTRVFL